MNTSQLLLVSSLGLGVNLFGMFAMGGHHHVSSLRQLPVYIVLTLYRAAIHTRMGTATAPPLPPALSLPRTTIVMTTVTTTTATITATTTAIAMSTNMATPSRMPNHSPRP